MLRAAPIALETGALFFGAFTGASKVLRDDVAGPCKKYVFNVRASYFDETEAIVQHLTAMSVNRIAVFYQNDAYGKNYYAGLRVGLGERKSQIVSAQSYDVT